MDTTLLGILKGEKLFEPPAPPDDELKYAPTYSYEPLFDEASRKHGVSKSLLMATSAFENPAGDPMAKNPNSSATGLGQFIDDTATRLGVDQTDPRSSIDGMGRLYRYLLDKFGGDETKAVAAYHFGEGAIARAGGPVEEADASGTPNTEYVRRVLSIRNDIKSREIKNFLVGDQTLASILTKPAKPPETPVESKPTPALAETGPAPVQGPAAQAVAEPGLNTEDAAYYLQHQTPETLEKSPDKGIEPYAALALGAAERIPGAKAAQKVFGVREEAQRLARENPAQAAIGGAIGEIGLALTAGGNVAKLVKTISNPMLRQAIIRAGTQLATATGQNVEEVALGEKEWKQAIGDVVQRTGGAAISMVPELAIPAGGKFILAQLPAQVLTDFVYDAMASKARGQKLDGEWLKTEIPNLGMSAGFAILDIKGGDSFRATQKEMQEDALGVLNRAAKFLKKRPEAKLELFNEANVDKIVAAGLEQGGIGQNQKPATNVLPGDEGKWETVQPSPKGAEVKVNVTPQLEAARAAGVTYKGTTLPPEGVDTGQKTGYIGKEEPTNVGKSESQPRTEPAEPGAEAGTGIETGLSKGFGRDATGQRPGAQSQSSEVRGSEEAVPTGATGLEGPLELAEFRAKELESDAPDPVDEYFFNQGYTGKQILDFYSGDSKLPADAPDYVKSFVDQARSENDADLAAEESRVKAEQAAAQSDIKTRALSITSDLSQTIGQGGPVRSMLNGEIPASDTPLYKALEAQASRLNSEIDLRSESSAWVPQEVRDNGYWTADDVMAFARENITPKEFVKQQRVESGNRSAELKSQGLAAQWTRPKKGQALETGNFLEDTGQMPKADAVGAELKRRAEAMPEQKPVEDTPLFSKEGEGKTVEQQSLVDLPKRKRGFAAEAGSIGGQEQLALRPTVEPNQVVDPEAERAIRVQEIFDKQDQEVRSAFKVGLKERLRNVADEVGKGVVDVNYYVKRLLKQSGPDGDKVIGKLVATRGSSAEAKTQYTDTESDVSKNLPHNLENIFNRYLQAARTIEVAKTRQNGEIVKNTGGMTADDAQAYINGLKKQLPPEQFAAVEASAKRYWDAMTSQLKQLKDDGLIAQDLFDKLSVEQPHYNPRRFLEYIDPEGPSLGMDKAGRKISVSESGLQKIKEGSEGAMLNNWRLLLAEVTSRTQARIFKNRAAKELLNYVRNNPDNPIGGKVDNEINGDVPNGFTRISAMVDGQRQAVLLPTKVAESWVSADPAMSRGLMNAIRIISGSAAVRPLATGVLAPEFALSNIPRDAALSWLATKEYSRAVPVALFQMARNYIKVAGDAWHGKGRYRDYIREGGGMDFLNEQARILANDPTAPMTPTTERNRQIWDALNKLQQFSERLGRLALREQALKNGKTAEEATRVAREYIDFSQGGSWTKAMDNAIPYLNAATQGTRSVVRAFKDDPAVASTKAAQLVFMGATLALMNNLYRKEVNDKISDREKVGRWNFPLPLSYTDGDGNKRHVYFSVPKDQGQRMFATFGEVATERAMGVITGDQAWRRIRIAFGDFSPVDVFGVVPPSIAATIGYALNKDFWTQDDIWKGRAVSPSEEYYEGTTPRGYVNAAAALKKIGVEISPVRTESAFRRMLPQNLYGGLLGLAYDETVGHLAGKERERINKTALQLFSESPGVRKYLRKTWPGTDSYEDVAEEAMKYGIDLIDDKGRQKSEPYLKSEVKKAEQEIADQRQVNDRRLATISKMMELKSKGAYKELRDLLVSAGKDAKTYELGEKEIKRLEIRLNRIMAEKK